MLVAFDFGISNTDIGVFQDNQTTFHTIPSKQESLSPELIKEMLALFSLPISEIKCIGVTGGKSSDLPDNIDSIKISKINEVNKTKNEYFFPQMYNLGLISIFIRK